MSHSFIEEHGIPKELVTDGAKEETLGRWKETADKFRIRAMETIPHSPWQNKAETSIKELKKATRVTMRTRRVPRRAWCLAIEWNADIRRLTVKTKRSTERC